MTRSERLTPVTQIAEKRERDAIRIMGECQRSVDDHEKRLIELKAYRDEYCERLRNAGSKGIDPSRLNDYTIFIRKLDEAIVFQGQQITSVKKIYERKKAEWMVLRTKSQALDKVVDKYKKEERRQEDKREQNESDERAQYLRRPAPGEID